jgi:hypothetical protein
VASISSASQSDVAREVNELLIVDPQKRSVRTGVRLRLGHVDQAAVFDRPVSSPGICDHG